MPVHLRGGLCAAALAAMPLALAQPAPRPADPLDAAAAVLPSIHRSSLSTYRGGDAPGVGSWKQANERVTHIGGWRAYAREAAAPASAASAAGPSQGVRP